MQWLRWILIRLWTRIKHHIHRCRLQARIPPYDCVGRELRGKSWGVSCECLKKMAVLWMPRNTIYHRVLSKSGPLYLDITYGSMMTAAEPRSDFKLVTPQRTGYKLYFVIILEKIDRVITSPQYDIFGYWLLGPPLLTWINLTHESAITSIIKHEIKLLIHSKTSTIQPLKFGNGSFISPHTLLGISCWD